MLQNIDFYKTVNDLRDLPRESRAEIVFAGRSNAGKSSAINAIVGRKKLAFVSKSPGRTQHINFFSFGDQRYLVDLPGYGYARVPGEIKEHWQGLLGAYLQKRQQIRGLVLVMDARHPLQPLDEQMLLWFKLRGRPLHVLLSKSDKLSSSENKKTLAHVEKILGELGKQFTVQLFSSSKKWGIEEAKSVIHGWLA